MLLPLTHKYKQTHTHTREYRRVRRSTNRVVLDRAFVAVSLKGTVILSAVKENPTMKRPCGTPADTMAAGRSGLLDLTGLYAIEQFTYLFVLRHDT